MKKIYKVYLSIIFPLFIYFITCLLTFYLINIRQTHIELNLNSQYNNIIGITIVSMLIIACSFLFHALAWRIGKPFIKYIMSLILLSNLMIDLISLIV